MQIASRTLIIVVIAAAFVASGQALIDNELGGRRSVSLTLVSLTTVMGAVLAREPAAKFFNWINASRGRLTFRIDLALTGGALCGLLFVAGCVLDGFPNSGDEYAFVLQATTYAQGQVWVQPPPLMEAFQLYHFIAKNGIWIGQYQPGWPLLLTPAVWLGLPLWVVNPVLGVALLLAVFALARQQASPQAGWIAVVAIACSAFFVLNAASYFSHVATALWGILFALFGFRYLQTGEVRTAAAAGLFIGIVGFTRAFNAIILLTPFVATLVLTKNRRSGLIWLALGGAPFLIALLVFNHAVTGDALTMVSRWLGKEQRIIVLPNEDMIKLMIFRLEDLAAWTSPLLPIAYAFSFLYLGVRRWLSFGDLIPLLTVLAFLLYPGFGGNEYGPRYYFEAFPFAIITVTKAVDRLKFLQNGSIRLPLIASVLLSYVACQAGYLAARLKLEHDVVAQRQDLFVKSRNLSNAVVLVASSTGIIRPMSQGDLVRNGLFPSSRSVIYAHDLNEKNEDLRKIFPDRQFYRYKDGNLQLDQHLSGPEGK